MGAGQEGRQEGLRARKMARTRAAVEEAAMGLFLDRGYAATTIDDIAAAVEVSPRTVLRYFGSKEDILFAREREAVRRVGELLGGRPATESVLGAARDVLARVAAGYDAAPERRLAWARLVRGTPALAGAYLELLAGFEAAFARFAAGRAGVGAAGAAARSRLQAAVVVAAFRVALERWEAGEGELATIVAGHLALLEGELWR
jgi:AcrR family transcriptional regulator